MRRTIGRFNLASRIVADSERSGRDSCKDHAQRAPTHGTSVGRRPQAGLILSGLPPFWLLSICSLRLFTAH